jgi:hypothetical protein
MPSNPCQEQCMTCLSKAALKDRESKKDRRRKKKALYRQIDRQTLTSTVWPAKCQRASHHFPVLEEQVCWNVRILIVFETPKNSLPRDPSNAGAKAERAWRTQKLVGGRRLADRGFPARATVEEGPHCSGSRGVKNRTESLKLGLGEVLSPRRPRARVNSLCTYSVRRWYEVSFKTSEVGNQ